MAGKGGKREGAGRPVAQHTIQAEAYKKFLIEEVLKQKGPLVKALIDKGLAGDVSALKEIHERTLGKVTDVLQVQDGGFLEALEEARKIRAKKNL